jgi:hypothetical protein
MKALLPLLALLCAPASAAITDRYVNNLGSGDGLGGSEANAMSYASFTDYMTTGGSFAAAPGDRFNVKLDGTFARAGTTDTWSNGGSATSPVIVRGYATTPGDGYQGRTNTNGPLITTNFPVITYTTGVLSLSGSFILLETLKVTSTRNGSAVGTSGTDCMLRACDLSNATTGSSGNVFSATGRCLLSNCDFALTNGGNNGTDAVTFSTQGSRIWFCRVKSSAVGITNAANSLTIDACTIFACTSHGINLTGTGAYTNILGNTIVSNGGDAIRVVTGTTVTHHIWNNCITDNTGAAVNAISTGNSVVLGYNRYRDNAGGNIVSGGDWTTVTDYGAVTTDTGGPETDYVNAAGNDYRLIATSPAVAAGIPASASIGALQRPASASTGTAATFLQ